MLSPAISKMPGPVALGLGLRPPFYAEAAQGRVAVDWFELISENFMVGGGNPLRVLDAVTAHYPVALHGVSLNLGGSDVLDAPYLKRLDQLVRRVQPMHVSDHLCWTRHGGYHLHDLLPLPYTEEAVQHVARRIRTVQDKLGCRILIENVSSYAEFAQSQMHEWEFLGAVSDAADRHILLDLNNIFVSAHNHGFDPQHYLAAVPVQRVRQIHLAGHRVSGPLRIDTHDQAVSDPVWDLYADALRRFGPVPSMIERDDCIPPLAELLAELSKARSISQQEFAA